MATARLEPAWWLLLIGMVCLMTVESLLAMRVSRGPLRKRSRRGIQLIFAGFVLPTNIQQLTTNSHA